MQRLIELLAEVIRDIREEFENTEVGEDPVHEVLKKFRERKEPTQEIIALLRQHLPEFNYVWFLTQTGLSQEGGFFSELIRRGEESFLPPIPPKNDIFWLLSQVISDEDTGWLEKITPTQMGRLVAYFCDPKGGSDSVKSDFSYLIGQMQKSLEILATRIAGLGLDPFISSRLREREELLSNFLKLGDLNFHEDDFSESKEYLEAIKNCERTILYVRGRRIHEGTSLSLTYRLAHIEELIRRFKIILNVASQISSDYRFSALAVMFKQILFAHLDKIKIRRFLSRNLEILAYQVTILTGNTGEHYITNNSKELRAMWWKAIKGGIVVAVIVLVKTIFSKLHLAPLPQAVVYGLIYATGFIAIHLVGGVLATKQPSMTASTLAAALGSGDRDSDKDLKGLVDVIVRTLRSQLAALFGNYLTAAPIGVLLVFPFLVWGHPVATPLKANAMLAELHPYLSLSFFYAAIAGVCLFISGLLCGLADNWFAFNQIGQRLENIFPGARAKRVVDYFRINFGIWVSNISLGFMLGSMSSIGIILGLPLDIRHVTFASGAFGIGWIHQREMLPWDIFAILAASVFVMGLVNLTVSFSLSLVVAMKSRRLKFSQGGLLMWLLFKRIIRSPHELFFSKE